MLALKLDFSKRNLKLINPIPNFQLNHFPKKNQNYFKVIIKEVFLSQNNFSKHFYSLQTHIKYYLKLENKKYYYKHSKTKNIRFWRDH